MDAELSWLGCLTSAGNLSNMELCTSPENLAVLELEKRPWCGLGRLLIVNRKAKRTQRPSQ
ncbi:hypothetical protein FOQG_15136 [Fusarium oxysporum f. sp. raphani 54005]|uniref:Uncharacterized protein n=2 Tax=Fusarium oxysporum TaxID=5507 RepID=X0BPF3_FUSOX|nr:hypothetical protein FOVG_15467 [Fusarium oxysporum f. sp. pisi HDV247]EXK80354.1 hypothetical protein FOQG_15136 [Fusarium oxysporum f. sp. raphani 54005]